MGNGLALLICLYDSIIFAYAAYLTFSSKKLDFKDKILGWFWVFIFTHFFLIGISLLLYPISSKFFYALYFTGYSALFFQITLGAFYLVAKITKNFIIRFASALVLLGIVAYLVIFFMQNATVVRDPSGEFYLSVGTGTPLGYGPAILIGIIMILCFSLILNDFRRGVFSWTNMAAFYTFYAFMTYTAISLVRVLRFLTHPWYLEIFYFFVPYLIYQSKKELQGHD